ncbi:Ubiquitin-conjugating enzyme E2-24 kDa [Pyrenophora tritici-repentis]|nr:Ubiquitin-conjugating enzyme E2-24 kDa [Pyrenophora tritici-repentis]KAI0584640.1 Ubiquitin-conjugating enzyme E2-24 kDa [Pyrenophora tritici-repentis]KAI0611890.1 Ubiquitin-conjugating enzyme E2-24 kDa [Pyrenophora tritici-repentis]KAI0623367.1 Ubiquitin-conjugating enzyme E2-24 kDa [Pyrenophora tritici-repentis]KAI1575102.1 Ubiquitin-protein ligase [Pyrenophora tritici-repentis]
MASNRNRRIAKEIADIQNDQHSKIVVEPAGNGDDLTHLRGQFLGPPDTPYEGATYFVDIKIPSEYPFRPPIMKFETKIWHPNVSSQTGAICLDTLSSQWSPVLTIKSALISLQSLLSTPEPKDPQDAEVAGMLIRNPAEFEHKAREWAVKFAGAPKKEIAEGSGAMGFDVEAVVAAFEYVGIDRMGGEDYELEEAYMGDITARLFGEA